MKIALIHDWLSALGGSEQTLLALSELYPSAPIFTTAYNRKEFPQFQKAEITPSFINKLPLAQKRPQFYILFMPLYFENLDLSNFDLVISNCHSFSKGIITKPETLHICYCHTPMRYVWTPWLDPRLSDRFFKRLVAKYLRIWDFQAAQRVDKFVANSQNVAKRIKKFYQKKAEVIYPPVKTSFFKPLESLNKLGNFYLLVGRLVSYKKPEIVIQAFNKLGLPLKIIGTGPELAKLSKLAKKNIEFLGRVSDEELKKYYREALAFIFPAEEDFGIVPVEAMASGRPVIAYKKGGVTETVKEGLSGTFFEEQTAESLEKAVKNFKPEKYQPKVIVKQALRFDQKVFKKKFKEMIKRELNKWQE